MPKQTNLRPAGKEEARQGASLVVVICVAALLMAFALAMLYTAGVLLSRANERLRQERSYQLAQSFSQVLEKELASYTKTSGDDAAPERSFYQYVYKFLEGIYGEYDPNHPEATVFHYTGGNAGDENPEYGVIRIALYKEGLEETDTGMSGFINGDSDATAITQLEGTLFNRRTFTVEVTATLDGVSYSYRTQYQQKATYRVTFRYNGDIVVWANNAWHMSSAEGEIISLESGDRIAYQFDPSSDDIQTCHFIKETYAGPEGGNP